jgi:collagenase-like PrtC family protease
MGALLIRISGQLAVSAFLTGIKTIDTGICQKCGYLMDSTAPVKDGMTAVRHDKGTCQIYGS